MGYFVLNIQYDRNGINIFLKALKSFLFENWDDFINSYSVTAKFLVKYANAFKKF